MSNLNLLNIRLKLNLTLGVVPPLRGLGGKGGIFEKRIATILLYQLHLREVEVFDLTSRS
jgi:hypothetical protein